MLMQESEIVEAMIAHQWLYPTLECVHVVSIAVAAGTIAVVDLHLLGSRRETAAQLVRNTGIWTLFGLVCLAFSGLMLFSTDPDRYYLNLAFQVKMVCLTLAIFFNYTIHRRVALAKESSEIARTLVAVVSLVLWVSVVFGGLFVAFIT